MKTDHNVKRAATFVLNCLAELDVDALPAVLNAVSKNDPEFFQMSALLVYLTDSKFVELETEERLEPIWENGVKSYDHLLDSLRLDGTTYAFKKHDRSIFLSITELGRSYLQR